MPSRLVLPLALAVAVLAGHGAAAQTVSPEPGLLWEGTQPDLALAQVAAIAAPVLWFSTDEPFILEGDRALPHPHPCDAPAAGGVVYYQVIRIKLRSGVRVGWPTHEDPFFVDRVESFTLRYHFYFRRHFGAGDRLHDLASADLDIAVDHRPGGNRRLRVTRVAGLVRGTEWYANELAVGPGTKLPVTILIEQGTHATAPDRNADGLFTVGHDINRRMGDAWGVRDLEAGVLMAGRFDVSMFKPRQRGYRMLPPDVARNAVDGTPASSIAGLTGELGRYELRPGAAVPPCDPLPPDHRTLRLLMRDQRFGPDAEPEQFSSNLMRDLRRPLSGTDPLLRNASIRRDRGVGISLLFRGINFHEGSLMPRLAWAGYKGSLEGLYTTSGARALGWYVSGGTELKDRHWGFVAETGLSLRARLKGDPRAWALGAEFIGFRVGIRSSGFDRLEPIRWVLEVGIGGW